MFKILIKLQLVAVFILFLAACEQDSSPEVVSSNEVTVAQAEAFVAQVEQELQQLTLQHARVAWVNANFVTFDTNQLIADASEKSTAAVVKFANQAKQYQSLELSETTRRKLNSIQFGISLPSPSDAKLNQQLANLSAELKSIYASGKYCSSDNQCENLGDLSKVMASSRDPEALENAWLGWRSISPIMRDKYNQLIQISNAGAKEMGFADTGSMWRSKYDMSADEFAKDVDRLWLEVKPLYDSLHCHVRAKLNEHYGDEVVKLDQPIPAHLLGNMWAQEWGNIYDLVAPQESTTGFDLTQRLQAKQYTPIEMVRVGEAFFTSLGFEPLPDTFWQRSLFTKPQDREVQCHPSAWDIDGQDDLRIKMCIEVNAEDFTTIHHELGHNFYQRAYKQQSYLFRNGANGGFHEAIGDTVDLSITPTYLKQVGLIDQVPGPEGDIGLLLRSAMDKVAFLPFGLMIDKWRWQVMSGEVTPEQYNAAWWQLRQQYQGIQAPVERSEQDFDPGAKFHVPASVSYTRYFLARILQFQFHQALCAQTNYQGPLHRCSIYGNKDVGKKFEAMLAMGSSKPWQDTLEIATGSRQMDATAILKYYAPLKNWLDQQNQNRQCGW